MKYLQHYKKLFAALILIVIGAGVLLSCGKGSPLGSNDLKRTFNYGYLMFYPASYDGKIDKKYLNQVLEIKKENSKYFSVSLLLNRNNKTNFKIPKTGMILFKSESSANYFKNIYTPYINAYLESQYTLVLRKKPSFESKKIALIEPFVKLDIISPLITPSSDYLLEHTGNSLGTEIHKISSNSDIQSFWINVQYTIDPFTFTRGWVHVTDDIILSWQKNAQPFSKLEAQMKKSHLWVSNSDEKNVSPFRIESTIEGGSNRLSTLMLFLGEDETYIFPIYNLWPISEYEYISPSTGISFSSEHGDKIEEFDFLTLTFPNSKLIRFTPGDAAQSLQTNAKQLDGKEIQANNTRLYLMLTDNLEQNPFSQWDGQIYGMFFISKSPGTEATTQVNIDWKLNDSFVHSNIPKNTEMLRGILEFDSVIATNNSEEMDGVFRIRPFNLRNDIIFAYKINDDSSFTLQIIPFFSLGVGYNL